jgi:hypothetical protein
MSKPPQFLTPVQDIAVNLAFAVMGERRINRTFDEYMAIAAKFPPLKVLTFKINQLLQLLHNGSNGAPLPEICRFKAGNQVIEYEAYPRSISYETVRKALAILGMREPRWRKANSL